MANITLANARKRLLKLVDDWDFERFNDDEDDFADLETEAVIRELDHALKVGQEQAWHHAASANRALFAREASLTSSSSGVLDLTSLDPIMPLLAVNEYESSSGMRWSMPPMNLVNAPQNVTQEVATRVLYVPRVAFPSAAATEFDFGHANTTAVRQIEELMLAYAAVTLLATEATANPVLDALIARLEGSISSTLSGSEWEAIPIDDLGGAEVGESAYGYVQTAPDTLQIVWRH